MVQEFTKRSSGNTVEVNLYCSTQIEPLSVEGNNQRLATVVVPAALGEIFVVEFSFSNTLITVHAYPKNKPHLKKRVKVNYHAAQIK